MNLPKFCKYCFIAGASFELVYSLGGRLICPNCRREDYYSLPEKPLQVSNSGNPGTIIGTASGVSAASVAIYNYNVDNLVEL